MLARFLLMGAIALFSGCSSFRLTPPTAPGIAVPAAWSTTLQSTSTTDRAGGIALAGWWAHFGDPMLGMLAPGIAANSTVMSAQARYGKLAPRDVAASLQPAASFPALHSKAKPAAPARTVPPALASMPVGKPICSAQSAMGCVRPRRMRRPPLRPWPRYRYRSPPRWRLPISSCEAHRQGSPSRASTWAASWRPCS
jgi:hypothetical protein